MGEHCRDRWCASTWTCHLFRFRALGEVLYYGATTPEHNDGRGADASPVRVKARNSTHFNLCATVECELHAGIAWGVQLVLLGSCSSFLASEQISQLGDRTGRRFPGKVTGAERP